MPATTGTETFADAITQFPNRSLHMYAAHAIAARQQWMLSEDMRRQSGWTTATDRKFRQWLVKLDRLRRQIIHRSGGEDQQIENLEDLAREMQLELPTATGGPQLGDAIARPSGRSFEFRYKLDGTDPDVPALSSLSMRNVDGFTLITALDLHITTTTRLDSRMATHRITGEEGAMLYAGLLEMWRICDQCGGDAKIVGVTEGVMPSEEPHGPTRSGAIEGGQDVPTRA